MRKVLVAVIVVGALGVGGWYYRFGGSNTEAAPANGTGAPGAPGRGRGTGGRAPLTIDVATVGRHEIIDYVTVVGNLIGEATVDIVPRVGGRLEAIQVKLGDRVTKGQTVAKIEDRTIREQINQADASLSVNNANVISRQNDLKVAQNNFDRLKKSFDSGLLSKQALEDAESRYNSASSQVDVAKAQVIQTQARIDELKITMTDTTVLSPVDGFVGRRVLDPGAFAGANTVIMSVVDISSVRLISNLVEKDFRRIAPGVAALVEVDAFPGESFRGEVSRVAPIFDPATRTASMEIEVPNPGFRLKPGMYARVLLTAERRAGALSVPRNAVVDLENKRGVYTIENDVARFKEVHTGLTDANFVEILDGITEGTRVITVGALALRDGDRVIVAGAEKKGGRGGNKDGGGNKPGGGAGQTPGAGGSD